MAEQTILIGQRIAQARIEAGLTQAALAAELPGKATGDQVSKWERGRHRPGDDTIEQIAKAVKKDFVWFFLPEPKKDKTPDLFTTSTKDQSPLERIEAKLDALIEAFLTAGLITLASEDAEQKASREDEDDQSAAA